MTKISEFKDKLEAEATGRFFTFARTAVYELLSFITGALLASVSVSETFSPFGVAFAVSVDGKYLISSCFGAAAGYILTQDSLSALRYICALLCSAVLISLLRQFGRTKGFKLIECITSFAALLLTGITVLFARDASVGSFAVFFSEACVGFAMTYIFAFAGRSLSLFKVHRGFRQDELQAASVCLLLILLSVNEISVGAISFSRIAAVYIILLSALLGNGSIAVAAAAGLIFSLDERAGTAAFIYTAAGLTLSFTGKSGRYLRTAVYFLSFSVLYALTVASTDKLYLLIEALTACIVFVSIPESAYRRLKSFLLTGNEPERTLSERQSVLTRLDSAATAVSQMTDCVNAASELLKGEYSDSELEMYSRIRDEVCLECGHFGICWTKNFSDCKRSFDLMNETLRNNRRLSADSLPRYLNGCCVRKSELAQSFTHRYLERTASGSMQRQLNQLRQITSEQLGGLHAMLCEMSAELSVPISCDTDRADRIFSLLRDEMGIRAKSVTCTQAQQGRLKIEIKLASKPEGISEKGFTEALEEICGVNLSTPSVSESDGQIVITVLERTRYRVEAAASRSCADSESLCGDSYEGFYDGDGNYYVVLSDGMGTGLRAAIDSSLTVTMAARLVKAGFSCRSTLRLVNCAMLLRSSRESLATADIIKIDLYSGKASFYKAGACRSLIKHRSKITQVDTASMPLGILNEVDLAEQSVQIRTGDLVLLSSDGAYEYCNDEVSDAFSVSLNESVSEITQRALLAAKKARGDVRSDDITVIAIRLIQNK